jgi:hypothetical protein
MNREGIRPRGQPPSGADPPTKETVGKGPGLRDLLRTPSGRSSQNAPSTYVGE